MKVLHSMLSPSGRGARLSTLIFHRVLRVPDPLFPDEVDVARFDTLCRWLAEGYNVLRLDEAVHRMRAGSLPARAVAITFDDGYADNHDIALPILQRHGLSATFFVATGFLDGGRMWNDTVVEAVRGARAGSLDLGAVGLDGVQRVDLSSVEARRLAVRQLLGAAKHLEPVSRQRAVDHIARLADVVPPTDLMMRSGQVQSLHRAGMAIGGHTVSHPILAVLPPDAARQEIHAGRERLQELLQAPVTLFAYPNGRPHEDYDEATVGLVREAGFEAAVTTAWGAASGATDTHQIPRFTPWDRTRHRFQLRLLRNLTRSPESLAPAGAVRLCA